MSRASTAPLVAISPVAAWSGFVAMCIGMFMAILDIQIVATSLPEMQRALGIPADRMSWIQTSYLIAEVIAIPLTGFLTRTLGLRRLFISATTVFITASIGCAASTGFADLIVWRVAQGFSGGMLIPLVFSAAFLLFPERGQRVAATLAGMLAVLAPTVGPLVGGWITTNWSWHWLFLVNFVPGLIAVAIAGTSLPSKGRSLSGLLGLDLAALVMLAAALAALEISLKNAPVHGWLSFHAAGLLLLALAIGLLFVFKTLASASPVIELAQFRDRNFSLACALSFILGIGLYGNVYLMPVFLSYVRGHDALTIGQIMLVTGMAQLAAAPAVVLLEKWIDARLLSGFGFVLFAIGLGMSSLDTPWSDFDEMLVPQIVRGIAIMFCLLPPTRIALGARPPSDVPDASALFNLMRNLGGAIGLALIDTVLFGQTPGHVVALAERLQQGDPAAFSFVGLPLPGDGLITEQMKEMARPTVERAAMTLAVQEAWLMLAGLTLLAAAIVLAICKPQSQSRRS